MHSSKDFFVKTKKKQRYHDEYDDRDRRKKQREGKHKIKYGDELGYMPMEEPKKKFPQQKHKSDSYVPNKSEKYGKKPNNKYGKTPIQNRHGQR